MQEIKKRVRSFLKKPYSDYVLIGALVGAIVILNLIWIVAETRPPHWDMARHLWTSLQYMDLLKNGKLYGLLANYYYYPPVLYLVVLPFYVLFGTSIPVAILGNTMFIAIAAFSMYGIGKQLWGRRTGLLASLFLLCSPMLITQFKEFQIDAPLTAVVSLALYLLIKNKEFVSVKLSILLGVVLGLGVLTKWTFAFIIIAPLGLGVLLALVGTYKERTWTRPRNLVLTAVAAYAVASVWYITNLHQIMIDLTQNGVGAGAREGDPVVGSFASNIWYGWNLISNQLYLIPFIFLLIGIVFLFIKKQNAWRNRYPIALAVGTLLFFTMLRNKDARYTLPALVGVSILVTYWITKVKIKTYLSVGLALYLAVTFYLVSFGSHFLPDELTLTQGQFPITAYAQKGYIIGHPSGENWQVERVFKELGTKPVGSRNLFYTGPDTMWFNNWDLMYYAARYNVRIVSTQVDANVVLIRQTQPSRPSAQVLLLPDGGTLIVKEVK